MGTSELINELISNSEREHKCVTITMDTHRMNNEAEQDPLRLKNLLQEAKQKLNNNEIEGEDEKYFLANIEELRNKPKFWLRQEESLIIFAGPDYFSYQKLPFKTGTNVFVDEQFYIVPLLKLNQLNGIYYLLALSKNNVRLLRANRTGIREIALENMPTSYKEFTKYDVFETSLASGKSSQNNSTNYHGKGDAAEDKKRLVEQFLKQIETEVTDYMRKQEKPLLLAGVKDITSHYIKFNHYNDLWGQEALKGNPDKLNDEELHAESHKIVQEKYLNSIYDQANQSANLINTSRFISDVNRVVKAAYYGQVERLFLQENRQEYGIFDYGEDEVFRTEESGTDLYNLAAVETLRNSGEVFVLDSNHMPQGAEISAVLRYPVSV